MQSIALQSIPGEGDCEITFVIDITILMKTKDVLKIKLFIWRSTIN
ncbi:MAG: hypothetical protein ACI9J3_000956 [Parvicellaceae bacterium]